MVTFKKYTIPTARLFWWGFASAALSLFLFILLLVPWNINDAGRMIRAWWDFFHAPAFMVITFLWMSCAHLMATSAAGKNWPVPVLVTAVFLVEFLQRFTGREQSVADIAYGWSGCAMGYILFYLAQPSSRYRMCAGLVWFSILAASIAYPVRIWLGDQRVLKQFPVLSTFDSSLEITRWTINGCDIKTGKDGWEITINHEAEYPGIFLQDRVSNWSSMTSLCVNVTLEGNQVLEMWVRVDDLPDNPSYFNRFQKPVMLQPGLNSVRLDRRVLEVTTGGRRMNLGEIHAFGVFFSRQDAGRVIRLTRIELFLAGD